MRHRTLAAVALLLCLAGCSDDPNPKDAEAFCADLAAQNDGCWNDDLDVRCVELSTDCETEIVILESCPLQLDCAT